LKEIRNVPFLTSKQKIETGNALFPTLKTLKEIRNAPFLTSKQKIETGNASFLVSKKIKISF